MKEFNVHFTDHKGRRRSRYFYAPNLEEAIRQFHITARVATDEVWQKYCDTPPATYKYHETGEIISLDALYTKYLEQHPGKEITFVSFIGECAAECNPEED